MIPNNNICLTEVMRRIKMDEIKDCIIIGDTFSDLHILPSFELQKTNKVTDKEIRLALDIIRQTHSQWIKADTRTRFEAEYVKKTFNFDIPLERIFNIKGFKQVLFKTIITKTQPIPNSKRYKVITKKIRK